MFIAFGEEHLYRDVMSERPTRRWGAGTSAIVRALVAATRPSSQSDLAAQAHVSQPRVSQVLASLTATGAVIAGRNGYRPDKGALIHLYVEHHQPSLAERETYWYGLSPLREQIEQLVAEAGARSATLAVSADLATDLIAPWRHPTLTVVYVNADHQLDLNGMVRAEGRADATIILRATDDATLLRPCDPWPNNIADVPIADPTQQIWDLHHLGGEDRIENADRLRDAILDGSLMTVR